MRFCRAAFLIFLCALLLYIPVLPAAAEDDGNVAKDITRSCSIVRESTKQICYRTFDKDYRSSCTLASGEHMRIQSPADRTMGTLYLRLGASMVQYAVEQFAADGSSLALTYYTAEQIVSVIPLDPSCTTLTLCPQDGELCICELNVYGSGTLPDAVPLWGPTVERCDLMILSTHPNDEWIYLGAVYPIYGGEKGYTACIAYVTTPNDARRHEALNGLWCGGVHSYPVFLGFPDVARSASEEEKATFTLEAVTLALVRLYRQKKPLVVVTQDPIEGEYGHWQHILSAKAAYDAVALAADPSCDPSSASMYGLWSPYKLYQHRYPEGQIELDVRTPLSAYEGLTALQVARLAYSEHLSQQSLGYLPDDNDQAKGDIRLFGLSYSAVGADSGNDMFENIDPALLVSPATAAAAPSAASTPLPALEETPSSQAAATAPFVSPAPRIDEALAVLDRQIVLPAGREDAFYYLDDGLSSTHLTMDKGQSLRVSWEGAAEGLLLEWYEPAAAVSVTLYGSDGTRLSQTSYSQTAYRQFLTTEGASSALIQNDGKLASLSELYVLAEGSLPTLAEPSVQPQADLVLLLSGVTDETLLMGGLLPQYCVENGMRCAVVYLGNDRGYLVQEAFAAYAAMGVELYPIFLNLEDHNCTNVDRMHFMWREGELLLQLKKLFLQLQPKIVVSCDPTNGAGTVRSQYSGRLADKLIHTLVKDEGADCSIQKLYLLDSTGSTVLDWTQPLTRFSGQSAETVAQSAYACYASAALYHRSVPAQSSFRLAYTSVGEDAACNDLLEHIDLSSLTSYCSPLPTQEATPTPAAAATSLPTQSDDTVLTHTAAPENAASLTANDKTGGGLRLAGWLLLCAAAALGLAALFCRKKSLRVPLLLGCVLLLLGGLSALLFAQKAAVKASTAVPAPLVSPADDSVAPVATPSPAPPTPSSTPSAVPDPNDCYFRQPGEAAEVVSIDYDAGLWSYRSNTLSISIERHSLTIRNQPQVIYVAHIRERGMDSFRSALATNSNGAEEKLPPWQLARRYKAVLAITGDNLTNAEKEAKGILIRDGHYYCDYNKQDSLAVYGDGTMGLIKRDTIGGLALFDSGVRDCYSFGPILVENGRVDPNVGKHRVAEYGNPRCGIGMIEPGHFVAIVTDGRDPSRAFNIALTDFAEMFVQEGVTFAYNLDGGSSAAMVFMGEHVNWHSGKDDPQRSWVDALLWGYSDLVPALEDPILHNGDGDSY